MASSEWEAMRKSFGKDKAFSKRLGRLAAAWFHAGNGSDTVALADLSRRLNVCASEGESLDDEAIQRVLVDIGGWVRSGRIVPSSWTGRRASRVNSAPCAI